MTVVVRIPFVGMAMQDRLRSLSGVRVIRQLLPVMIELVGSKTDSDRRPQGPGSEACDRSESATSTEHGEIVQ